MGIGNHIRSNVVGYVALFVALTGGAVALEGKNSVDSGDIKAGNVKRSDLAKNAVDASRVRDDSLGGGDVDEASLGKVPNAANADAASTLDGLDSTDFLRSNAVLGTANIDESSLAGVDAEALAGFDINHFGTGVMGRINGLPNAAGTLYGSPVGASTANGAEDSVEFLMPDLGDIDGTAEAAVTALIVRTEGNATLPSGSRSITLRSNGDLTVSCTISSGQSSCNALGASDDVVRSQPLSIEVTTTGTPGTEPLLFAWTLRPTP